jgi:hypothetical protein
MFGGGAVFSIIGASAVSLSYIFDKFDLITFMVLLLISCIPFFLFSFVAIRMKRYEYVNQEILQYSYSGKIESFSLQTVYGYSFSSREPNHVQIYITKSHRIFIPKSDSLLKDLQIYATKIL